MLILILALSFIILIGSSVIVAIGRTEYRKSFGASKGFKGFCHRAYENDISNAIQCISTVVLVITLTVAVFIGALYSQNQIIDDKIALYEQQNEKIEAQVATAVESYKDFEATTFENCKPEDLTLVLTLYPELSSNELVKQQIHIYQDNNAQILLLKEKKLNMEIYRWWLFFG